MFDVAIIGAGPAGSVSATILARAGWSVVMIDPAMSDRKESTTHDANGPHYKIGEALPGAIKNLLHTLALPSLAPDKHLSISGAHSFWAGDHTQHDFITQAQGCGWRLDRKRFERDLFECALDAGAEYKPLSIERIHHDTHWQLHDTKVKGHNECPIKSRFLIDASGRRSVLSTSLSVPRKKSTPLVAVWSSVDMSDDMNSTRPTTQTLIESQNEGWWYGAHLPNKQKIAIFHTDAKNAANIRKKPEKWINQLERTHLLKKKIHIDSFQGAPVFVNEARTCVLQKPYGDHWAACGDAALSFDPLSSQGIFHAIASADMLCKALQHDMRREALLGYHQQLKNIELIYRERRDAFYRRAYQFHQSTFWAEQCELKRITSTRLMNTAR